MKIYQKILLVSLLLTSTTLSAHELHCPDYVPANGAGYFEYEVIITITSPAEFGYIWVDGTDNTDIGEWIADGFCMATWNPGQFTETVTGHLLNLHSSGSVVYEHYMCDGWTGIGTTIILPPAIGNETTSLGHVKNLFR
ncbi:MAG: hypothetical protein GY746_11540 [Gammaproteobacteria bacterium]|nr:hypothetical protein [Gammaproteobacteria bacterium]